MPRTKTTNRPETPDPDEPSPGPEATEPTENDPDPEPETPPEPAVWLFTGARLADGRPAQFLSGIPARDLTQTDLDALPERQQERMMTSGLYRDAQEAS